MFQRAKANALRTPGAPGSVLTSNGDYGTWAYPGFSSVGDAAKTLQVGSDATSQRWASPLTAPRAVTLSTAQVAPGATFRITRTPAATGASALNVGTGPLKALAVGQWCDVTFDGSAWYLSAFGSL